MHFQYLEIRPCIDQEGGITSFRDEADFNRECHLLTEQEKPYSTMWAIYGIDQDSDGQNIGAVAIGDFTSKAAAHEVMNGIIAPMAKARDLAEESEFPIKAGVQISPAEAAAYYLNDFINQCSNEERI